MQHSIINNLFELWALIGHKNHRLYHGGQYTYTRFDEGSWPSKVFNLTAETDFKSLHKNIRLKTLPNAVSILENETIETLLVNTEFKLKSTVKGMYLDLTKVPAPETNFNTITKVNTPEHATAFANVASQAFGYQVAIATLLPLLNNSQIKLFIGSYKNQFVNCGMVILDSNEISGIHMIGTIPEYRGFRSGKSYDI